MSDVFKINWYRNTPSTDLEGGQGGGGEGGRNVTHHKMNILILRYNIHLF